MPTQPSSPEVVAKSGPTKSIGRDLRRLAAVAVVGAGLVGIGLAEYSAPAVAQFKPGTPAETLSFADIVDRVKPAVVSISTTNEVKVADRGPRAVPAPRRPGAGPGGRPFEGIPGLPDDHPLNEFFKNMPGGPGGGGGGNPMQQRPRQAAGSGFVVSSDGYIVTNNHVVDGATKVKVSFDDQEEIDAKIVGTDSRTDLALLKIEPKKPLTVLKFAEKTPRVGDWVLAVGNPFGLGGTVTAGIVSALARNIGGPYDYMQIDAAVNHGNSGGPTFNLEGDVVGVNTAIYSPTGGNVGIAFAVPAETVKRVVEQLEKGGTVSRGWLGVKIQNIDKDLAGSLGLKEPKGAIISEVMAARSGGRCRAEGRGRDPVDRFQADRGQPRPRPHHRRPAGQVDGRREGVAQQGRADGQGEARHVPEHRGSGRRQHRARGAQGSRRQRRPEAARPQREAGPRQGRRRHL